MLKLVPVEDDVYPRPGDPYERLPRAFRRGATRRRAVKTLLKKFAARHITRRDWRIRDGIVAQMQTAALQGDLKVLRRWLEAGVPANWDMRYDWSVPMYWAAQGDQVAAAELLHAYGASVSTWQKCLETPLHWAVQAGSWRMTRWLLEHGCDPMYGWNGPVYPGVFIDHYRPEARRPLEAHAKTRRALIDADPRMMFRIAKWGPDKPSQLMYEALRMEPVALTPPKVWIRPDERCYRKPFRYRWAPPRAWTTHVWFVRHGQSAADAGKPTRDPASIALTERGQLEAGYVAEGFPAAPDLIVRSPMVRAKETAVPLLARFADAPRATWPVEEFTFLDPQRCAGTTREQRRAWVEDYWRGADPHAAAPGAESFAALMTRVEAFWRRIRERHRNQFVVVFTHGEFIRAALWHWTTQPKRHPVLDMAAHREFGENLDFANGEIVKTRVSAVAMWYGGRSVEHIPKEQRAWPSSRS